MSNAEQNAIEVSNLVKDFRVQHRDYGSLKAHAAALAKSLARRRSKSSYETRRVLDDVSFNVKRGEAVAIVGRNGSGKSTLLSIISRVYLPTSGQVRLNGRLISLLQLGAGFNPDLTGTENVFFNGTVLGLTEDQVAERYDEIITFAELGPETMDLPVRMYSSGMQMRLGFAIAVHMEADVLIVDEALSVGDEGFKKKSFMKTQELKASGRTMLIVTHETAILPEIADRVIWMQNGRIMGDGDVASVITAYTESFRPAAVSAPAKAPASSAPASAAPPASVT
jgi:ABC-type polysaccharide/polyol phosphate transport system ATPase subunit